jgi:hypothetical protein
MLFSYSQKQRLQIHYTQRAQKERLGKKRSMLQTCETRQVTSFQSTVVGWAWDTFSFSKRFTGKKKEVTVSEYVQSPGGQIPFDFKA